jgi:hypothetical protein
MESLMEPRSTSDIVQGLLTLLQEHEWVERYRRCGRGCCGEWETICSSCDADEGKYGTDDYRKHKPDCQLAACIREAEAFLRVEETLASEQATVVEAGYG